MPAFHKSVQLALLRACSGELLERTLSNEMVYLGFQKELQSLDPNSRKQRTSEIVSLLLGESILENKEIRKAIAADCKIKNIHKWKPGSEEAIQFCDDIGFPRLYGGFRIQKPISPYENLFPPPSLRDLEDYQLEAVNRTQAELSTNNKALLSLPTGAGKTRVATEIAHQHCLACEDSPQIIWVAHTDELCDQAVNTIKERWLSDASSPNAILIRAWGSMLRNLLKNEQHAEQFILESNKPTASIIVTTPPSLTKMLNIRADVVFPDDTARKKKTLIIIDEAHRAAADSYKDFIRNSMKSEDGLRLLGLSATPIRSTYSSERYKGTQELAGIFGSLVEPIDTLGLENDPTMTLIERGVLSTLQVKHLSLNDNSLSELTSEIANIVSTEASGQSMLFTNSISDSRVVSVLLNEAGISSQALSGMDSKSKRWATREDFRKGKIRVLCNCELLTTGFDAPAVSNIFLARNTNSQVLYKQIVGRGMRGPKFGGSQFCKLYLCGINLKFDPNPNTAEFARQIWSH